MWILKASSSDNPFVGCKISLNKGDAQHDLLWVTGLRNPWKFSLLPDGRVIIADVGQKHLRKYPSLKGDNLGWNVWEGNECLETNCSQNDANGEPFVFPVHTYPHSEGQSITGGMVLSGEHRYNGQYMFGDFMTGKVWVLTDWDAKPRVESLTQLDSNISTFAQDVSGNAYVADFGPGVCIGSSFHNDACLVAVDCPVCVCHLHRWYSFSWSNKALDTLAFVMLILRLVYLPLDSQDVVGHSVQYLDVFRRAVSNDWRLHILSRVANRLVLVWKSLFWSDRSSDTQCIFGVVSILWLSTQVSRTILATVQRSSGYQ